MRADAILRAWEDLVRAEGADGHWALLALRRTSGDADADDCWRESPIVGVWDSEHYLYLDIDSGDGLPHLSVEDLVAAIGSLSEPLEEYEVFVREERLVSASDPTWAMRNCVPTVGTASDSESGQFAAICHYDEHEQDLQSLKSRVEPAD